MCDTSQILGNGVGTGTSPCCSLITDTTKKKAEILRFQDSHLIIYIMMWLLALDDVAVLFLAEGLADEGS